MPRKVFYSFDYDKDNARVQQIKNIGRVESQPVLDGNKWEEVRRGGDAAIKKWIDDQMVGKTCLVVLVGERTANRRWVQYEIRKAWESRLGVVGVRIHGLKNFESQTAVRGPNPFDVTVGGKLLSSVVTLYDPPGIDSKAVYASLCDNIEALVENAIAIRARN